jgi:hypothetical protein
MFCSLAVHEGCNQGPRDDLLSLCYIALFLLKGRLPWMGLNLAKGECIEVAIYNVKTTFTGETLFKGFCDAFPAFFAAVSAMEYGAKMDFAALEAILKEGLKAVTGSPDPDAVVYDWRDTKNVARLRRMSINMAAMEKNGLDKANSSVHRRAISREVSTEKLGANGSGGGGKNTLTKTPSTGNFLSPHTSEDRLDVPGGTLSPRLSVATSPRHTASSSPRHSAATSPRHEHSKLNDSGGRSGVVNILNMTNVSSRDLSPRGSPQGSPQSSRHSSPLSDKGRERDEHHHHEHHPEGHHQEHRHHHKHKKNRHRKEQEQKELQEKQLKQEELEKLQEKLKQEEQEKQEQEQQEQEKMKLQQEEGQERAQDHDQFRSGAGREQYQSTGAGREQYQSTGAGREQFQSTGAGREPYQSGAGRESTSGREPYQSSTGREPYQSGAGRESTPAREQYLSSTGREGSEREPQSPQLTCNRSNASSSAGGGAALSKGNSANGSLVFDSQRRTLSEQKLTSEKRGSTLSLGAIPETSQTISSREPSPSTQD